MRENSIFIHTDKKLAIKYFISEKPKVIGEKDRKGKITYVPQLKYVPKKDILNLKLFS